MRDCCSANQFSGCCTDTVCLSGTTPLIELDKKLDATARARRATVDKMIAGHLAAAALAALTLTYLFVCIPEMRRLERIKQESVVMEMQ